MMRFILAILSVALSLPLWAAETAQSVTLFNGKDFTGWKLFLPDAKADPAKTWAVKDGVVMCTGNPAGYMRTETPYENYRLRVEWRWPKDGGNSGVLLHIQEGDAVWPKSIEAQLHSGDAGDFWVIGGTEFKEHAEQGSKRVEGRRTLKLGASSEKPLGEWNQYEITCKGNSITVKVNGIAQNIATDCTVSKGFIGLQSEGTPVEFRNIILEPLK